MPEFGQTCDRLCHSRGQLTLVHERPDVGVAEDMLQLGRDVAVVDVDGHGADLERRQHALHVLGAVEELDADVVAGPDACAEEVVGQAVGALLQLGVGEPALAAHQRHPFRHGLGHALEEVGQVVLRGRIGHVRYAGFAAMSSPRCSK